MVHYFLEGGAFMWPILLTLIFGLAFVIERAYSLMMSAVDSEAFFDTVSQSIKEGGPESIAKAFNPPSNTACPRPLTEMTVVRRNSPCWKGKSWRAYSVSIST